MKVIFLDVDGVLNNEGFLSGQFREHGTVKTWFDVEAIKKLNKIIDLTQAKVVLSSSWRLRHKFEEVRWFLVSHGFTGDLIDKTPDLPDGQRGNEIQSWLDSNKSLDVSHFVILDDEDDMAHLTPRLVQTTFLNGLLDDHADRAIQLLMDT